MLLWECLKKGNLIKSVDFVTRLSDLQAPNLDPITGIDVNQIRPERSPPKVLSDRLIDTIFIEKPDPVGPMGAKGLGEHVLIPTAPAILNAIRDASGAEINQLPALPHRVLAAIRQAQETAAS